MLAWLTSRVRDSRFQLPALAYLVLAVGHALVFEASPNHFFRHVHHPASGVPALLAVAVAAVAFGLVRRSWQRALIRSSGHSINACVRPGKRKR